MTESRQAKVALVTGASGGIGSAIARELGGRGITVVAHGRDQVRTRAVADAIEADGGRAYAVCGGLESDEGAESVVRTVAEHVEVVDILINNAGGFEVCTWWQGDPDRWRRVFEANVGGAVRMIQAFVPGMRERGWGRVIQVASVSATVAPPLFPDYAAAKAAMLNSTVSLARALVATGVTANTVSPGPVETETWERFALQIGEFYGWAPDLEKTKERLLAGVLANPVGRLGRPEDVANAVAFLASEASGYINAVNLRVDGGLNASF